MRIIAGLLDVLVCFLLFGASIYFLWSIWDFTSYNSQAGLPFYYGVDWVFAFALPTTLGWGGFRCLTSIMKSLRSYY